MEEYFAEKLFERNIFEKYVRIYLLKVNNKSSLKAQEKTFKIVLLFNLNYYIILLLHLELKMIIKELGLLYKNT